MMPPIRICSRRHYTCHLDAYNRGTKQDQIFTNRTKSFIDQIHSASAPTLLRTDNIPANHLVSLHIYDSLIIFEKAKFQNKNELRTGMNPPEEYEKLNPKLRRSRASSKGQ